MQVDYAEYVVTWHGEDPSSQPLLDLEGWLRATGGVSRSWVIRFGHSFDPPVARWSSMSSSQASMTQTQGDAHVEDVVQRLFCQRPQSFQDVIRDMVVEILQNPYLYDQLNSLLQPSQQVSQAVLINFFICFKFLYLKASYSQA